MPFKKKVWLVILDSIGHSLFPFHLQGLEQIGDLSSDGNKAIEIVHQMIPCKVPCIIAIFAVQVSLQQIIRQCGH